MPTLVLLRHGQSQWNLENRFTGWWDVDLSEAGVDEARAAGSLLREKGFDLCIDGGVVAFIMQRGFHPRLGARPLRDTIETLAPTRELSNVDLPALGRPRMQTNPE